MPPTPRVRFAPAPTGFLHVGGARTALFNWLFARHHDATFILRIEDTDLERSREEWVDGIKNTLDWMGLAWDEGPYRQSARLDRYRSAVDELIATGTAYESYATPEELDAERDAAKIEQRRPRFFELAQSVGRSGDRPRTVWMRVPAEGTSSFTDVVRGDVSVEWSTVADFMIQRSSGAPIFYLANAVDDLDMGITHIIRGEDLLDSTHRVLAIRAALAEEGASPPTYAHLPLLLGTDRRKLSKRHGEVALEDFRDRGYLPEALLNYLALLGFPAEEGQEIQTIDELVARFDLSRVVHHGAVFDHQKLDWMNGEYIRALSRGEFTVRTMPFGRARYGAALDEGAFESILIDAQERAVTLDDAAEQAGFLFVDEATFSIDEASWAALIKTEKVAAVLDAAIRHLEQCEWIESGVDLRPVLDALEVKPRKAMPALYSAVEGRSRGLPLFSSMVILGRERTLSRLRRARERLGAEPG